MAIKLIKEMSNTELGKVFDQNEKLRHDVLDDMLESEMHHISEQLSEMKNGLSDWSVGTGARCYMRVDGSKVSGFLDGVRASQNMYCVLADKDVHFLNEAENTLQEMNDAEDDEKYYELEELLSIQSQGIADTIAEMFEASLDYCYDRKEQRGYFIEFYVDERLKEGVYVKDDSYTMYEDVSYTKNFN